MPYDENGNWIDPSDPYGGVMPAPNPMAVGFPTAAKMPPPVPYKAPPEVDAYQSANKAVQDQMAKNAAMPTWQKVARGIGAAGIEFLGHHRAPDASAQLASALQNPGMQGRLARLSLSKQSADEARQNAQLEATTGLKNAMYGLGQQRTAGMQENQLRNAGAEPITAMPPPTPPASVGMPATVTAGNVPPLRPGAMPPPQPPTVTGGQNDVLPALGAAMQANGAPPMTNRIGNYGQTFDPVAALQGKQVPLQVPPPGEKAKTDMMSSEMAQALGRPTDAGQHFEPAQMRQFEGELEKRRENDLGPRVDQLNQMLQQRWEVLHPGEPINAAYKLAPNATKQDYDRIEKSLSGEENASNTAENRKQTLEMRKQTMAIAAQNQEQKQDAATKKAAYNAFTPAMDSAERFNVMTKNYEEAVKNHDQQAMLSLLANHLGMTMGLQKGARLTKDIIHEAEQSRPWLQGMAAKFDNNGYLAGVTLTPEQMRQMVALGRERFSEDISKARNQAQYMGSTDDGPKRTPSRSTINHYLGMTNGDMNKAKALAAEDGWSTE